MMKFGSLFYCQTVQHHNVTIINIERMLQKCIFIEEN